MNRTEFLRKETLLGNNKLNRRPIPKDWDVSGEPLSLPERKALGFARTLEHMPLYIGDMELIVGTRTFFGGREGNQDGHDRFDYSLFSGVPYVNEADIACFGANQPYCNKTHYTPDYGIILEKGVDGILAACEAKKQESGVSPDGIDFLNSVIIAYSGLKTLILRYSGYAYELAEKESDVQRKAELEKISQVCSGIAHAPARDFYDAVQLLWFAHTAAIIESFEFINYGRVDIILEKYLGNTERAFACQLVECLLLKMYDQVDINESYLKKYAAQLNVTVGGVLPNGENAVGEVSFMLLSALEKTMLPEPEFSVRVNSKNPPEFLSLACRLAAKGINCISFYNDNLFIEALIYAGVAPEIARDYSFDLCQDVTIAGKGDFYTSGGVSLAHTFMDFLAASENIVFSGFDEFFTRFKECVAQSIRNSVDWFNKVEDAFIQYKNGNKDYYFAKLKNKEISPDLCGRSLMAPLPYLSGLYHGTIENAADMTLESYPVKHKGFIIGCPVEAVNSLAAIKLYVFEKKEYTLAQIYHACKNDFSGHDGEILRNQLWNAPKWGNDDDYADSIAKEMLEFACREILKYETPSGGRHLAGIHQPHPVPTGHSLMATPEGRKKGRPAAVTLTPESGTMQNGPTAALKSAAKLDHKLISWNNCVMVNYLSSVFSEDITLFERLIKAYFAMGGMQHQPNILNIDDLKKAQLEPEQYKDLIVRLWGVSAHFVELPKELQDEIIARFV